MCASSGRPGSGFSGARPLPSETNTSRKPNRLETRSPSLKAPLRDFSTRPSAPPMIASPSVLADAHAGPQRRIDRHDEVAHQHLAVGGIGDLGLDQPKVVALQRPLGAADQVDLAARRWHGRAPRSGRRRRRGGRGRRWASPNGCRSPGSARRPIRRTAARGSTAAALGSLSNAGDQSGCASWHGWWLMSPVITARLALGLDHHADVAGRVAGGGDQADLRRDAVVELDELRQAGVEDRRDASRRGSAAGRRRGVGDPVLVLDPADVGSGRWGRSGPTCRPPAWCSSRRGRRAGGCRPRRRRSRGPSRPTPGP